MLAEFIYRSYRFSYHFSRRKRRQLTVAGIAIFISIIFSAALSIDTTTSTVYQLFSFFTALFVLSFFTTYTFKAQFSVTRTLPQFITVGDKITYKVQVKNKTGKTQSDLLIQEQLPYSCPSLDEFISSPEPGEHKRNIWDRKVMYHRFSWLQKKKNGAVFKENILPPIAPHSYADVYLELNPYRRGYINLFGMKIKRPDPFGLFKSLIQVDQNDNLLVLPKRYIVSNVVLPGIRKHHAGGVSSASSVGNTDEFMSLRDYQPGDAMRRIHWKSYAKTGKLVVKENEDEFFVRHALILDTFSEQKQSDLFEVAVSVAASFVSSIRTQESLLDLMFVEDKAHCFSVGRGVDHTGKLLELLAGIQTCIDKPFSTIVPSVMSHAQLLSGCICIFINWDDARRELVKKLQSSGIPVVVLVVYDPQLTTENEMKSTSDYTISDLHFIDSANPEEALADL